MLENPIRTAIASVTASNSSFPRWPQNTELMKLMRNTINWAKNWEETENKELHMNANHHMSKERGAAPGVPPPSLNQF